MLTSDQTAFLLREGLVAELAGEVVFSTRAVALLTGTPEEAWTDPDAHGGPDPFDRLYELAKPRKLIRNPETDERLRALDD